MERLKRYAGIAPGQTTANVDPANGVSLARVLYAFNSTNAEGWGLYAEYITLPYMPKEGQLISLQFRLLRAARAFIDRTPGR